jgi:type IV pilus assembly protein PilC
MATTGFKYKIRDQRGKVTSGTIVAESKDALRENLIALNFEVMSIKQMNYIEIKMLDIKYKLLNVPTKDLILFFRQFNATLKAGIPIPIILESIAKSHQNKVFREALNDIGSRIKKGEGLSQAFRNHVRIFDNLLIAVLEAGEMGGFLETVIERYAITLEKENEMKKKVWGALTYPIIVLIIAALVIFGLFLTIVPKIKEMFRARKMDLPPVTEMLFLASDFFSEFWFIMIPGFIAGIIGLKTALKSGKLKYYWDKYLLKLPIMGDLILLSIMSRFCYILVNLQDAGVSLIQSLDTLEQIFGNEYLTTQFRTIKKDVSEGKGLAESFEKTGIFPPIVVQMVKIGEDSGRLSEMLLSVASFFEQEVDYSIKSLTSLIEPIMIVCLGGTVLFIALALLMPIINLTKSV